MNNKFDSIVRILMVIALQLIIMTSMAQISWPTDQILPSFPATSSIQDLVILNGTTLPNDPYWRWESNASSIDHSTGRLDTDGWLCQTGIDAPNLDMILGPNDLHMSAGASVAEFRMMVDNNTANNDPIVDIEIVNTTSGVSLASQRITRKQFSIAGNYVSFKLNFTVSSNFQAIKLRVKWLGTSYTKVDWMSVRQDKSASEQYLFSSLKGIVNMTQPRIFSYEGDAYAEGPHAWLGSLGLAWIEYDRWELITKYSSEIAGLIVYDPDQIHTVNLATMLAKDKKALIVSPSLVSKLTSAPYNFKVLLDLRNQFSSKLQVYQTLFDTYWPNIDHRLLIGLSPEAHKASLREYAVALGAAVIWLDPNIAGESELLNRFLSSMPAGANFMGWWPEEGAGVTRASSFGISTIASDYATNLSVHSGMPRTVNIKAIPPKPALENKIYVAFIISDGDNLQYVEHLMRKLWDNPDRGSVPIGWTISPAMLDAMPGALNFYYESSTKNDNLISGPSGYGYVYPNNFPNQEALNEFVSRTEDYNSRAGLRVVTVWNTIVGGIDQNVGESFADYAPSLLGLTGQNTGGPLSIYNESLPGKPLSCNYCSNVQYMKEHIASAAAGWNGAEPLFVIIQAQPWNDVTPTSFKEVAHSLNADYKVVRPDHLFQLLREFNGLPIDPSSIPSGRDITDLGGVVSVKYDDSLPTEEYPNLIDNNINTKYVTLHSSGWVQYQAPGNYVVDAYTITSADDEPTLDPFDWTLQGSNDGSTWISIDVRSEEYFPNRLQTRTFNFSNNDGYTYYRFNMSNSGGDNLQLAEVELFGDIFDESVGTDEVEKPLKDMHLYPNPVTNELNIKGVSEKAHIVVVNLSGTVMKSEVLNQSYDSSRIDVSSLSPGLYLIKIEDKGSSKEFKFVKR